MEADLCCKGMSKLIAADSLCPVASIHVSVVANVANVNHSKRKNVLLGYAKLLISSD